MEDISRFISFCNRKAKSFVWWHIHFSEDSPGVQMMWFIGFIIGVMSSLLLFTWLSWPIALLIIPIWIYLWLWIMIVFALLILLPIITFEKWLGEDDKAKNENQDPNIVQQEEEEYFEERKEDATTPIETLLKNSVKYGSVFLDD